MLIVVAQSHLTSAGNSSPRKTHGTGPRPTVKTKVKERRQATGSQAPAACSKLCITMFLITLGTCIITDSGSCFFRKKTVPSNPIQREHRPVEAISKDLLPAMLTTTLPRVAPITCTPPGQYVIRTGRIGNHITN